MEDDVRHDIICWLSGFTIGVLVGAFWIPAVVEAFGL